MTCSFSKEYSAALYTGVENEFITAYLPYAKGDTLKVYLYGLYLCSHPEADADLSEFSRRISIPEEDVLNAFKFWEEFGILSVLSIEPLSVTYYPVKTAYQSKPRKYKAEKYSDFTKSAQAIISERMISTGEYTEYFDIMETYFVKPDAMLMIIKYCADMKGADIGYRYVSTVAKDFANRGIITAEKVEKELSSYLLHTAELEKILKALSSRKKPDIEDQNYFKKWTQELSFEPDNIAFAAKTLKKGSMAKLDAFLMELYSAKRFSKEEIADYAKAKQDTYELALKINRALSVYVEVVETEIDEYLSKWIAYGFTEQTLLLIANRCFKTGKNTLRDMDELVDYLRTRGFIDLIAVNDYFEQQKTADEFISKILLTCGINRRPTPWDRENLAMWRSWNFSDEMILEAAKISSGKNSPAAYMNGVLSKWKNSGVFTVAQTENEKTPVRGETSQEAYNAEYARRRNVAVSRAQKNVETAMATEGFAPVYDRLSGMERDLAFAELSGNAETLAALEKEKVVLTAKAEAILKTVNLSLDDLSPRYACEKCRDTGYVGTHRCDCYDKKPE